MEHAPPLAALQAFEAAGRSLSFKAAADELHVTPSAISHRIRGLELQLGVKLFLRRPGSLSLSPMGRQYLSQIQGLLQQLEAAARCLKTTKTEEEFSVHSTPSFAAMWLMPKVTSFIAAHPHIQFKINSTTSLPNFAGDKVDVDIRYDPPRTDKLHVEALTKDRVTAFCSRAYFERVGGPRRPRDLRNASFIQLTLNRVQWRDWLAANEAGGIDLTYCLRSERSLLGIQAAVAGLGIVLESQVLCGHYHRTGELIKMFPESADAECVGHFLVCPKPLLASPVVRKFRDWLKVELEAENRA